MANHNSRLFTLRLWKAASASDLAVVEWRGKVQSLPDGEAYYFRDWLTLIQHLETMLESGSSQFAEKEVKY